MMEGIHPSIHPSFHPSIHPSICPFIHPSSHSSHKATGPLVRCGYGYGHRATDTDTFSLCPFDTATRPVVGLSNYSRTATGQELCRVRSEIATCGAGWVAVSVSAQVDADPMFSTCLFQTVSVSVSVSVPHKWTRSFRLYREVRLKQSKQLLELWRQTWCLARFAERLEDRSAEYQTPNYNEFLGMRTDLSHSV